jgi:hypothetical protein
MTVPTKLNKSILSRMLRENNSLSKKYSDTMSSRRITIKTVSFFIIKKRKAAIQQPFLQHLKMFQKEQYWFGIS